jgi:glycosyltransferase involved in cell wall biosynthesis
MVPLVLSVVVPAFNEEARIAATIFAITTELDVLGVTSEVVIVDDGSSDATAAIAGAIARAEPRVRVIGIPHGGKGSAVRRGMLEARGTWRFLADADLSTPIAELRRFLSEAATGPSPADIIVGSREAAGATRVNEPWRRHAVGRLFNWMVKLLVLRGVNDTQCGFKLFSGRAAEIIFPLQQLDGFGFDVEVLFLARRAGLAVREIPVPWVFGGESKVNLLSGARGFLDLALIRWNQLRGAYPPVRMLRERQDA